MVKFPIQLSCSTCLVVKIPIQPTVSHPTVWQHIVTFEMTFKMDRKYGWLLPQKLLICQLWGICDSVITLYFRLTFTFTCGVTRYTSKWLPSQARLWRKRKGRPIDKQKHKPKLQRFEEERKRSKHWQQSQYYWRQMQYSNTLGAGLIAEPHPVLWLI